MYSVGCLRQLASEMLQTNAAWANETRGPPPALTAANRKRSDAGGVARAYVGGSDDVPPRTPSPTPAGRSSESVGGALGR